MTAKWGGTGKPVGTRTSTCLHRTRAPHGMSAFGRWMYGPWFWPPATREVSANRQSLLRLESDAMLSTRWQSPSSVSLR